MRDTRRMLRTLENLRPDVLLLDEVLTDAVDGRRNSVIGEIHRASPVTRTLLVNDGRDEGCGARALQRGARGCVSTNAPAAELLRAIRAVSRGEVWVGRKEMASVLDVLLTRLDRRAKEGSSKFANLLSERELQIADAVKLGLTNKEIGRKLRISPTTVKTHLENIFHKLHVTHRVQLAILAGSPTIRTSNRRDPGPERAR
ncbi:MAG TPA: response regulator transcription factor [Rudaea sp.]|nr:response regulator transcription factor [Rudaea sp.]